MKTEEQKQALAKYYRALVRNVKKELKLSLEEAEKTVNELMVDKNIRPVLTGDRTHSVNFSRVRITTSWSRGIYEKEIVLTRTYFGFIKRKIKIYALVCY